MTVIGLETTTYQVSLWVNHNCIAVLTLLILYSCPQAQYPDYIIEPIILLLCTTLFAVLLKLQMVIVYGCLLISDNASAVKRPSYF